MTIVDCQSTIIQHRPIGNQQLGMAVAQHKVQALGRIGGIQRHVGAPGCQHADRGYRHPLVAWYQDADDIFPCQPLTGYLHGDVAGLSHQFLIGKTAAHCNQCDVIGRQSCLTQDFVDDRFDNHILEL